MTEKLADTAVEIVPAWRDEALGTYYAAWPFVEYGQFVSLSYAGREALTEALTSAIAVQAEDKLHGDPVTPLILAGARRDTRRHLDAAKGLVAMVLEDPTHRTHKREVITGWRHRWIPPIVLAAQKLRGLFARDGIESAGFQDSYDHVCIAQRSLIVELGLC